ncbi:hypothetical protein ERY430_70205 [Erythrobacter sp. EC-HK427]|nr:hypothetical protein ERY430_70205 [Erythrobacter sp. EC-HK427]
MDQRQADLTLLMTVVGRSNDRNPSVRSLHWIRNHLASGGYLTPEQFQSALDTLIGHGFIALEKPESGDRELLRICDSGLAWVKSNIRVYVDEKPMWEPLREDWQMTPPAPEAGPLHTTTDNEGSTDAEKN